ncbi:SRPBCC domain-containing protein [Sphingoaurantiacus capsulatus]|uniref:SRPBCC domain-containing protein n=1 Tax=Sphingoaurantiacus capsulatus TaxID=1771310 RepID=A0ABV7X7F9_9SPHN
MPATAGIVEIAKPYAATPAQVFAAWASPQAMLIWSAPPPGWTMACTAFRLEIGHADEWRFGPEGEAPYVNINRYVAIEPDRRLAYTTTLSHEGQLDFAGSVCVTFEATESGCHLTLIEAGIYLDADDRDGHEAGWQSMLDALADYLAKG